MDGRFLKHLECLQLALNHRSLQNRQSREFSLPEDIQFSVEDCDFPDSQYDGESHRVIMCYQWIDDMYLIVSHKLRGRPESREIIKSLVIHALLHETAHALIHTLKIPVTGREEDDSDQFATIVLLNQREGARKALQVARVFRILSQVSRAEPSDYWDEHSLDAQRYFDMLCMIYGRDPERNAKLVRSKLLPEERADRCEEDYRRIESSWKLLLRPYANDSLWLAE